MYLVSFTVLASHLVLPLVLAVVVDHYKAQQKSVLMRDRIKERRALAEAFYLLDTACVIHVCPVSLASLHPLAGTMVSLASPLGFS